METKALKVGETKYGAKMTKSVRVPKKRARWGQFRDQPDIEHVNGNIVRYHSDRDAQNGWDKT